MRLCVQEHKRELEEYETRSYYYYYGKRGLRVITKIAKPLSYKQGVEANPDVAKARG